MSVMTQQETYLVHLFKKLEVGDREHLIRLSAIMAERSNRNPASHLTLVVSANRGAK